MGRIIVSELVDGVIEAPGHEQHRDREERLGVARHVRGPAAVQGRRDLRRRRDPPGRVTYQIFAVFWPTAPKDFGFADG
jgi:hypothetical protein